MSAALNVPDVIKVNSDGTIDLGLHQFIHVTNGTIDDIQVTSWLIQAAPSLPASLSVDEQDGRVSGEYIGAPLSFTIQVVTSAGTLQDTMTLSSDVDPLTGVSFITSSKGSCAIKGGLFYCWDTEHVFTEANTAKLLGLNAYGPFKYATMGVQGVEGNTSKELCGITTGNALVCQHYQEDYVYPNPVHLTGVRHAALGSNHGCAAMLDGTVRCWGQNNNGKLGVDPDEDGSGVQTPAITGVSQVATGHSMSCALKTSGEVYCWGADRGLGSLGNAAAVGSSTYEPVQVDGLSGAVEISSGTAHTCARLSSGAVTCWGRNYSGVQTMEISGATQISANGESACALTSAGDVYCWGMNTDGQLGSVDTSWSFSDPALVSLPKQAIAVSAGGRSSCAVLQGGDAYCWGSPTDLGANLPDEGPSLPVQVLY